MNTEIIKRVLLDEIQLLALEAKETHELGTIEEQLRISAEMREISKELRELGEIPAEKEDKDAPDKTIGEILREATAGD